MFEDLLRRILEIGFEVTVFFVFLAFVLPKEDPWIVIKKAFRELVQKRHFYKWIFGAIGIYFLINVLETKFDYLIEL